MKTFWIIVFIILLLLNCFNLIRNFFLPIKKEKHTTKNNGVCHEQCYHFNNNNNKCTFFIVKLIRKVKKKTYYCPGAASCRLYKYENPDTGEIERANLLYTLINSLSKQIPALTAVILTCYEIIEKING